MAERRFKKLAPAFAGSSFEQTVPVPVAVPIPAEVESPVIAFPQNPPRSLTEVRGLRDFQSRPSEEASAPAVEPVERAHYYIDHSQIGLLVQLEEMEEENMSESQNENQSSLCAAPANMADGADGAGSSAVADLADTSDQAEMEDLGDMTELADAADEADGAGARERAVGIDDSDRTTNSDKTNDSDGADGSKDSVVAGAADAAGAVGGTDEAGAAGWPDAAGWAEEAGWMEVAGVAAGAAGWTEEASWTEAAGAAGWTEAAGVAGAAGWTEEASWTEEAGAAGGVVQENEVALQSWPEEEEIYGILHQYKSCRRAGFNGREELSYGLGILNIPAAVTRLDLHHFLAPFQETIDEIKIIRDTCASRYMAVIKFNAQDVIDTFYSVYNGCSFNDFSSEICQLVYVRRFEVLQPENGAAFQTKGLIELPRCFTCLERTGETRRSTLIWLCDQSFECHRQNAPLCCPVCNYYQVAHEEETRCLECRTREGLHTCLICGFVGCGREVRGHANKHFNETKHTYGMQLNDCKVWDYAEDNYVHSDLQQGFNDMGQYERQRRQRNLDPIQLEYSYLLTKHLESQQLFWERKITQLEKETDEEISNMKAKLISTTNKCNKLEYEVTDLIREKKAVEDKCALLSAEVVKLFNELKEEQAINNNLRNNQLLLQNQLQEEDRVLKHTCEQIDTQISAIQDNIKDIMVYLETQRRMNSLPDETKQEPQEEQISTAEDATASSPQEKELFQKDCDQKDK